MTTKHSLFFLIVAVVGLLAGCAAATPRQGRSEVEIVTQRRLDIGASTESLRIETLLAEPLTPASAIRVALLNNPEIQIILEEVGIAEADLIEAGLLENPSFFGSVKYPNQGGGRVVELDLAQNILSLLLRPSTMRLSEKQFELAKLRAAEAVLSLAAEVEQAWYEAVGARHLAVMKRMIVESSAASYQMAQRLHRAGNISDLELERELGMFEEARVALGDSELQAAEALMQLTRLLGLWGDPTSITIPDYLPGVAESEPNFTEIERLAVEQNLGLSAMRREVEVVSQALGITRTWSWLGTVEFSVLADRELDGQWISGPGLTIDLPIFYRRQGEIARQEAMLRQAEQRLIADAIGVRAEVRRQRDAVVSLRRKADHLLLVSIPNRERIVRLALREYNYMLVGVFEVLEAKRDEYADYEEYIATVTEYWKARAALRRAAGGSFTSVDDSSPASPSAAPIKSTQGQDGRPAHG